MEELLKADAHRPWPLPRQRPWVMQQTWNDLLFAHWPVPATTLRPLVPTQLELDLFDASAWVAITPFLITGLRPRGAPGFLAQRTLELNVRTYVRCDGKPGVYFFSLDVASLVAVWGARVFYRLPYWHAGMWREIENGPVRFRSRRLHGPRPAEFTALYRPAGPAQPAPPGSLEHFLTERYCLYTVTGKQRVYRAEIHHLPWPLQPATADITTNTMAQAAGIALPDSQPLLHFASRLQVLVWAPERIG